MQSLCFLRIINFLFKGGFIDTTLEINLKTNPPVSSNWETFHLFEDQVVRLSEITKILVKFKYENNGRFQVVEAGEFSFRGGLLDIWLEKYKVPVRIDLIGEKIENIYLFNPLTNEKLRKLKEVHILPFKSLPDMTKSWKKVGEKNYEKLFLSEIKEGDFVVHIDNGLGKFHGFVESNGVQSLAIEYARGDKLYVPVGQIERLTKYIGVSGRKPILNSLGTGNWERTKQKVQESVVTVAKELLELYAKRELVKRRPYSQDSHWQKELENSFEYKETLDQLKVVEEIKNDLESYRPMDRLLVGDVGFGKTEIAIRTAFKVVENGKQVAFLVPTTILAEQHYHLFKERLKAFPVRVELISRVVDNYKQRNIISDVEKGVIDIIIGTHRIISKEIKFSNLGLLIIDEEHRFGVNQKEKLKKTRSEIDILSLSATPIPRSLHMSLTKIRDISLLTTAPFGRLSIQTKVAEFNTEVIKTALETEIIRGGQAFYLSNRIATISAKTSFLKDLLPGRRIEYAHGQMKTESQNLEEVMEDFIEGKVDVLVCSTIIASGLDIPNVNTIILENAQKFGLADLYQLRGRVGRSETQAYAYLFYPKGYKPEGAAASRLLAISQANELGSGFKIAQSDLEIRGAGNLLGNEQSGSIALVGFELYLQLLIRATEELKSR